MNPREYVIKKGSLIILCLSLLSVQIVKAGKQTTSASGEDRSRAYVSVHHDQKDWYCTNRPVIESSVDLSRLINIKSTGRSKTSKSAHDYVEELKACREQWRVQKEVSRANRFLEGYHYLMNAGVPLLAPPPKIARKMTRDAERLAKLMKRERARMMKEVENSFAVKIAEKVFTNKDHYEKVAKVALDVTRAMAARDKERLWEYERQLSDYRKDNEFRKGKKTKRILESENKARQEIRKLKRNLAQYERDQKHLEKFIKGVEHVDNIQTMADMLGKLGSGRNRDKVEGMVGITKVIQGYLGEYVQQHDLETDEMRKLTQKLEEEALQKYSSKKKVNELLNGMNQSMSIMVDVGNKTLKAHQLYNTFLQRVAEAEDMAASGKYSDAEARLITAFDSMSNVANEVAPYLPKGASEVLQVYAEAMRTPGAVHKMLTKAVDRYVVMADVSGSQATGRAMKEASAALGSLDRPEYKTGLSVYAADRPPAGGYTHVLIPDKNGRPIFLTTPQFQRLQEYAYYWTIVYGKRMNDAEAAKYFGNLGKRGLPSIKSLKKEAEKELERAARKMELARLMGKKTVTEEDMDAYYDFNRFLRSVLPSGCAFDPKRKKRLFAAWRETPDDEGTLDYLWRGIMGTAPKNRGRRAVEDYLRNYGSALKKAEDQLKQH